MARTNRTRRQRLARIAEEAERLAGCSYEDCSRERDESRRLSEVAREWELRGWGGSDDTTAKRLYELADEAEGIEAEIA